MIDLSLTSYANTFKGQSRQVFLGMSECNLQSLLPVIAIFGVINARSSGINNERWLDFSKIYWHPIVYNNRFVGFFFRHSTFLNKLSNVYKSLT
jgi:hypothetical protein